jgi:UDP-N-acetylglucosamine 2-epimerase (non-hydrolysing)
MKVAPLIRSIRGRVDRNAGPALTYRLVHTGQHYDERMSAVFFSELGIPEPDINLAVGSGSHARQTADIMTRFEVVCQEERPDWVGVVGDVNSTIACSLVAAKMGIRIAHVEAGLRSFDRTMPEEINRLVTDALADLLLTPSADANENLRREGIPESRIDLVGNVMIDALVANLEQARARVLPQQLGIAGRDFAYVTLHRPANVDDATTLTTIMTALRRLSDRLPVVFPMHPRTRKMGADFGLDFDGGSALRIVEPIGYHDSLCLTETARLVVTDSGGLQEESTFFRTPCLTLRPNTERPVTVDIGSNKLTSVDRLAADIDALLARDARFGAIPPLWDGRAAERIVDSLLSHA